MDPKPNEVLDQSTSTPSPVVKKENKPKKSHNALFFLLGILIVLVLVGGIGGGYYFGRSSITKELNPSSPVIPPKDPDIHKGSPTSEAKNDETTDWKTYKGDGYSFKYPAEWTESESKWDNNNIGQGISLSKIINPNTAPFNDEIGVNVVTHKSYGNLTAEQFLRKSFYGDSTDSLTEAWMKDNTMEPIKVGDKSGTKFNHMWGGVGDFGEGIWVSMGKDGLFIKLYPASIKSSGEIYKTLLSTFQFTN